MIRLAALLALVTTLGCSSNDPHGAHTSDAADAGVIGCNADPRALAYAPRLGRPGDKGALKFELVAAEPGPPMRGDNTWTVRVTDAGGGPLTGATLEATPVMPDHGHGSSVTPKVTANPDGTFTVGSLNFSMPGLWQVTLTVKAGATTDTAAFSFCVAG